MQPDIGSSAEQLTPALTKWNTVPGSSMAATHCHPFLTMNPRSYLYMSSHSNFNAESAPVQSTCRSETALSLLVHVCVKFTALWWAVWETQVGHNLLGFHFSKHQTRL